MASDLPAGAFSKPSTIRAAADRSSNDLSPVLNDRDNVCCHRVIAFRLSSSSQDGWHGMELATKQDTPVHKLLLSKSLHASLCRIYGGNWYVHHALCDKELSCTVLLFVCIS
ncbi:uncharacterized protein [Physcomitrium patens]|uniref:uncharacterized protein isoform X4 n=2 Tax=Physcomitrium patens TaxID=3218 RepID=UPI003CCCAFE2